MDPAADKSSSKRKSTEGNEADTSPPDGDTSKRAKAVTAPEIEDASKTGPTKADDPTITMVEFRFRAVPIHYPYSGYLHIPMVQDPVSGKLTLPQGPPPGRTKWEVRVIFTSPQDYHFFERKRDDWLRIEKEPDPQTRADDYLPTPRISEAEYDDLKHSCSQHNSLVTYLVAAESSIADEDSHVTEADAKVEGTASSTETRWKMELGRVQSRWNRLAGSTTYHLRPAEDKEKVPYALASEVLDNWVTDAGGIIEFKENHSCMGLFDMYTVISEERPGEAQTWNEELASKSDSSEEPQWENLKFRLRKIHPERSREETTDAVNEYKRYLALCIVATLSKKYQPRSFAPSEPIHEVWRCHLLHPSQYRRDVEAFANILSCTPLPIRHELVLGKSTRRRYQEARNALDGQLEKELIERIEKAVPVERQMEFWPELEDEEEFMLTEEGQAWECWE